MCELRDAKLDKAKLPDIATGIRKEVQQQGSSSQAGWLVV